MNAKGPHVKAQKAIGHCTTSSAVSEGAAGNAADTGSVQLLVKTDEGSDIRSKRGVVGRTSKIGYFLHDSGEDDRTSAKCHSPSVAFLQGQSGNGTRAQHAISLSTY